MRYYTTQYAPTRKVVYADHVDAQSEEMALEIVAPSSGVWDIAQSQTGELYLVNWLDGSYIDVV
jgi:hypothetical protein